MLNSDFGVNSNHIFSGIIVLSASWNSPVKSELDAIVIKRDIKKTIGKNQKKLLFFRKKVRESRILAQAFLEFVKSAAKPIVRKKKIAVDFLNTLFTFSVKNEIENGQTRLNQAPA